jgi:hypothetical protein
MIYVTKNTTNYICLTLKESSTIANPFYLFVFEKDVAGTKQYYAATDLSNYKDRYNLFELDENDSGVESGVNVAIKLKQGQYTYSVYETETLTDDITEVLSTTPLEIGRMLVEGDSTTPSIYD